MTDRELLDKKLAQIETHLRELREEADLELLHHDLKEERFVAHTLQLAIQAALVEDVVTHHLDDLEALVHAVRSNLDDDSGTPA